MPNDTVDIEFTQPVVCTHTGFPWVPVEKRTLTLIQWNNRMRIDMWYKSNFIGGDNYHFLFFIVKKHNQKLIYHSKRAKKLLTCENQPK